MARYRKNRKTGGVFRVVDESKETYGLTEEQTPRYSGQFEGKNPELLESVNIVLRAAEDLIGNPKWEEHEWEYEYRDSNGNVEYTTSEEEVMENAAKGPNDKYPSASWSITLSGDDGVLYDLSGFSYRRGTNWVTGASLDEADY